MVTEIKMWVVVVAMEVIMRMVVVVMVVCLCMGICIQDEWRQVQSVRTVR